MARHRRATTPRPSYHSAFPPARSAALFQWTPSGPSACSPAATTPALGHAHAALGQAPPPHPWHATGTPGMPPTP
eukprot:CAMPEP_0202780718 /NCGR_PEP_ID=MMETSP1388-20130828/59207_1 /ASSEMBLY_ACC=CAM_ASM_000864 /TAXON_ID=37098 /ORGANISM="Isochrysis sp, Strain CCMP1244" /LENGTH=74 /DNA_ID=CAMNT_0049450095 /DNA_START=58 /DNA_END=278 /DNA_ORIENTATION=-